ncbi:serine hydrolase domain-containing protein [Jiangella asiatica]|uniref:Class A beta-lactamase-related serine hydrolase n=1 Tax=Jiangella asiatica TaxID=2530372 RepID=A0A4R5D8M0_9ACTN|nr:serine hydrolase domain-containing protein [Jiangella asiatica]TDE09912.1 class A beta-lactamase-related serine hydrolase [Jiangella asiatica]
MSPPAGTAPARVMELLADLVDGGEVGLQVAAYLHGELVVDAWAGLADRRHERPVTADTLFHGWSAGKGVTATAVHVVAEAGWVDYDAPVAAYWPEFAERGKGAVTLRHALTHAAGVPDLPDGVNTPAQLHRWDDVCAAVADLAPRWVAGAGTGYHAFTFGWIVGEVIRRATGRTVDDVVREDIAGPLGVTGSLYCAVPPDQLHRMAVLELPAPDALPPQPPALAVGPDLGNDPVFLTASVPAVGTMTARALARMYAAVIGPVDGVRLLPPERVRAASAVQTSAVDQVLLTPLHKSLGYLNGHAGTGGRTTAFGMNGAGGGVGFADPGRGFAFALMRNRMNGFAPAPRDPAEEVAAAVRSALALSS